MSSGFGPGDFCPHCSHPLEKRTPWFGAIIRRKPFLKCLNCRLTIRGRSRRYQTSESTDGFTPGCNNSVKADNSQRTQQQETTCVPTSAPAGRRDRDSREANTGQNSDIAVCGHCGQPLDKCSFYQLLGRQDLVGSNPYERPQT